MSCGSWCVYYRDRDKAGICNNCSYHLDKRSRFDMGKVDVFELARLMAVKEEMDLVKKREEEEWEALPQWAREGKTGRCPGCCVQSLMYNKYEKRYECLNLDCKRTFTIEEFRESL